MGCRRRRRPRGPGRRRRRARRPGGTRPSRGWSSCRARAKPSATRERFSRSVPGIGVGEEAAELVPLLLGVEAQRPGDEAAGQRLPGFVAEALVALGGVDAQQADFLLAALEPDEQGVAVEDLEDLDAGRSRGGPRRGRRRGRPGGGGDGGPGPAGAGGGEQDDRQGGEEASGRHAPTLGTGRRAGSPAGGGVLETARRSRPGPVAPMWPGDCEERRPSCPMPG